MSAEPKPCPDCGAALEALGTHRGREQYRCRPCNMRFMFSVKGRRIREEQLRSAPRRRAPVRRVGLHRVELAKVGAA